MVPHDDKVNVGDVWMVVLKTTGDCGFLPTPGAVLQVHKIVGDRCDLSNNYQVGKDYLFRNCELLRRGPVGEHCSHCGQRIQEV
jgi:hypothetical protein